MLPLMRSASGDAQQNQQRLSSVFINGLNPGLSVAQLNQRLKPSAGRLFVPPESNQRNKTAWIAYLNELTEDEANRFQKMWNNKIIPEAKTPLKCEVKTSSLRRQGNDQPESASCNVFIMGLPPNVSVGYLASIFQQKASQLVIPPESNQRNKNAWCAYLNDLTKKDAENFIKAWNRKTFPKTTTEITCKFCRGEDTPKEASFSVLISGLPPNVSVSYLASRFKQRADQFVVLPASKQRDKNSWCAYLNGLSENAAESFQRKYNNHEMKDTKRIVQCQVKPPKSDNSSAKASVNALGRQTECLGAEATSSLSSVSTTQSETAGGRGLLCKHNILGSCKFGDDCKCIHFLCPLDGDCDDDECCLGHSAGVKDRLPPNAGRRLRLCNRFRSGTCRFGTDCRFQHIDCPNLLLTDDCDDPGCYFGHPEGQGSELSDPNECSVDCDLFDCKKNHPAGRTRPCKFGDQCNKFECRFLHSERRQVCESGKNCEDLECAKLHPDDREKPCEKGAKCININCTQLHPIGRPPVCTDPRKCSDFECARLHARERQKKCNRGANCKLPFCPMLHPKSRTVCELGEACDDIKCTSVHPLGRVKPCRLREGCWNPNCEYLHPDNWNPCPKGLECSDVSCACLHSPRRPQPCPEGSSCADRDCNKLHPQICTVPHAFKVQRSLALKSDHQRKVDREVNPLPVLSHREEFLRRLESEKVLIVRAETGSGKTTQLPQYAAERFGGLVICTQLRVMAAVSIAHRVADEFDGCDVGESVGYKVGGDNSALGTHIMFMTEACLIRYCQDNDSLHNVSVLIIDEAHERSLNVDIVLGLAKLIRLKRPDNFYVVIASATIDPQQFRKFFDCNVFDIPGRMYDVSLQYIPPVADSKPDAFIKSHVVPNLIKALQDNSEGYALVFLPGEREIQQALKHFQEQQTAENFVALPLYGSLPREEQLKVLDFKPSQDSERLVVFCTNVAETSLTINGVRLVVDSGLAKESRFDPKRRITVLEMKQISQSAADQRKGRAGRTAPGHCVRLYAEATLKNAAFVPEILRSSLDLVILLLIKLKLKPLEFPFIDKPNEEMLIDAHQTLMDLGCLSGGESLTKEGELFAELGIDPRLSAFVARAHRQFGQLDLALTIVCILTAPGSLFYLGRDKERREALQKRALEVFHQESDVLYEVSVFESWANSGKLSNGKCTNCDKRVRKFEASCKKCRIKHSNSNRLNNKVMEHIEKSRISFRKAIQKSKWFSECQIESHCDDAIQAVGVCLEQVMHEQVTCLLVQELPSEGVKIVESDIRARISNTSVFAQRTQSCQYFVAVRVRQALSGMYSVDCLHPLKDPTTVSDRRQHPLVKLFTQENVSTMLMKQFRAELSSESSPISKEQKEWIVLSYHADEACVDVYARARESPTLSTKLKPLFDSSRQLLLKETVPFSVQGLYTATLACGLKVQAVKLSGTNPTVKTQLAPNNQSEQNEEADTVVCKQKGLTQLFVVAPCGFEEQNIRLISSSISEIRHTNRNRPGRGSFGLSIENLPSDYTEFQVKSLIANEDYKVRFFPPRQAGIGSSRAHVTVKTEAQRESLIQSLPYVLLSRIGTFSINIIGKKSGRTFAKQMSPEVKKCEAKSTQEEFSVKFSDATSAKEFFEKLRSGYPTGCSAEWLTRVYVNHSGLFPDFEDLIERSCDPTVKHNEIKKQDGTVEVCLIGPDHDKTSLVAKKLYSLFSPTKIRYFSCKEKTLFTEIKKAGQLRAWEKELKLKCEFQDEWNMRVFGPKVSQGSLMRKIADEFTNIEKRYRLVPLNAATAQLFRRGLAGESKLKELQQKWIEDCFIKFLFRSSEIEVFARKDASLIDKCIAELANLIRELSGKNKLSQRKCVLCSSPASDETFFVCGHSYCSCFKDWLQSTLTAQICCPKCQTPLTVKQIQNNAGENFQKLVKRQVAQHVSQDRSLNIACCIVRDCDGFVKKGSYEKCACCQHFVCVECKTVDDILHKDRNCSQFKSASTADGQISELIKAAEVFVRQNWPADMPPICNIDPNPGLLSNPRCPALSSFLCGLNQLNRGVLHESDGLFAYHGSSSEALKQICHSGFDPKRRSGQAYGPGEYFGETASVSSGYSRNCGAMIVAFLLNGGPRTHRPGFCYVVKNPIDGSASFNLPVLVVYFDQATPRLEFIKPRDQLPLTEPYESEAWKSPFRWHWQKDGGSFEPYTDEINQLFESHYDAHKIGLGPAEFTTPPIRRYVDDTPQPYVINFSTRTQKNSKTGYIRSIRREQVDVGGTSSTWEFQNESGHWTAFESLVQQNIQRAYTAYVQGSGSCTVKIQFPGRPETYELDFLRGLQKNLQSGKLRPIRKI